MLNSHNDTLNTVDLLNFFVNPTSTRQKQYEVVRAIIIDNLPIKDVASKFGYKVNTIYALLRDAKSGKIELFPQIKMGPKERRIPLEIQEIIIALRKENLSTTDIHNKLKEKKINVSIRTIERVLKDKGFKKLKRRTYKELGITLKGKTIPNYASNIDFEDLSPFKIDCPVIGVFFFIPYIIESGIIDIIKNCNLPESSIIGSTQACLSMLLLKLIGNERLSHIQHYDMEPGLGLFAGLNILPKTTYMCTYSCRTSEEMLLSFQEKIIWQFKNTYPNFYQSRFINLDFHSIPHYGDEQSLEKIWCGSKGKAIMGANSIIATDGESNAILYTRADILRKEEAKEIQKFIQYWKKIKGNISETLVFDCKFTKYVELDKLTSDGIKFITLRRRSKKMIEEILEVPGNKWKKVNVPIPKRKYKKVSVYEKKVTLSKCENSFRQIVIKDHGRAKPTFIISNNWDLKIDELLLVYAKRWRIENKISEIVSFFNLNALSSPIMIRIHFDVLWTMIADTLYHRFAQDLRRFETSLAPTIFKKFINMPGKICYDGEKIQIRIRKRSHTPILKGVEKLKNNFRVPWLGYLPVEIIWTA
jgi:transposase